MVASRYETECEPSRRGCRVPRPVRQNRRLRIPIGRGPQGGWLTLIETVRQDADRQMTIFDQEFVERVGQRRQTYRSSIAFRTLTVAQVSGRLERAGFRIDAVLGDYGGREWSPDADVWVIVAKRGS